MKSSAEQRIVVHMGIQILTMTARVDIFVHSAWACNLFLLQIHASVVMSNWCLWCRCMWRARTTTACWKGKLPKISDVMSVLFCTTACRLLSPSDAETTGPYESY